MAIEKSKFKDQITKHFNMLKRQSYVVEQWDNLEIFYDPISPIERIELNRIDDPMELNVQTLINKARDADGNPMFTLADKAWLMRETGANVVQVAAQHILLADFMDPKELGKPSPPKTEA